MTVEAVWNDVVIARSDATVVVEGNHYFPREDVEPGVLVASVTTSFCPWKGEAHYYSVAAGGKTAKDGAWYYPEPKAAAAEIRDRLAFWNGVKVGQA